jgi:thiosulfate reductase cytochrome b subunit
MVNRHSFVARATHAVFSLAFLILAVTGAQIYFHAHWLPFKPAAVHLYCGFAMIACGLVYLAGTLRTGELRKLLFGRSDEAGLVPMAAYYLRLRANPPRFRDYNPLQKLAYTIVLFFIAPLIAATGVGLWLHVRAATIWHVGFAIELVLFFFGHMLMVATTGLRNNLRAMTTGWFRAPESENSEFPETVPPIAQSPAA